MITSNFTVASLRGQIKVKASFIFMQEVASLNLVYRCFFTFRIVLLLNINKYKYCY